MTESLAHSVLDFSSPRRSPTAALRQLSTWQRNAGAQIQESWGRLLAHRIQFQPGKIEAQQHLSALNQLPEEGLGVYFSLGESLLPSMMVFSARQVQGLIADLLDMPGEQWPEVTALTAAEDAMLELLFQEIATAIGDAWPGAEPLKCQFLETTGKPQRTRLFPLGSALFSIRMKLTSRFGEETCTWLVLKEDTERLMLDHLGDSGDLEERSTHPDLLARTEKVPLQITVELGKVELRMSQASSLAIGDVLILDQLVSRPLIASLEGIPKWAGVPMRIGSRQAFEVTHIIDQEMISSLPLVAIPEGGVPPSS